MKSYCSEALSDQGLHSSAFLQSRKSRIPKFWLMECSVEGTCRLLRAWPGKWACCLLTMCRSQQNTYHSGAPKGCRGETSCSPTPHAALEFFANKK